MNGQFPAALLHPLHINRGSLGLENYPVSNGLRFDPCGPIFVRVKELKFLRGVSNNFRNTDLFLEHTCCCQKSLRPPPS